MECPVCLENNNLCKLSCTHYICNNCLSEWLGRNNNSCPLCRKKICKLSKKNYPNVSSNIKIIALIYPNMMWISGTVNSIYSSHITLNDCIIIHNIDKKTFYTKLETIDFSIIEKLFYI